jgi:hypothetical protein
MCVPCTFRSRGAVPIKNRVTGMLQSRHWLYAHGSTELVERRPSPRCDATGLYRRFREPTAVRVLIPTFVADRLHR